MDCQPRPVDHRPSRPQTMIESLALAQRSVGSRGMAVVLCESLRARRDPRHRTMGCKLAAIRSPPSPSRSSLHLLHLTHALGTAKTGPRSGSRAALSRALNNDKDNVMDWQAGRAEAGGKMVEVRVPDLVESRLNVCLLRHVPQGGWIAASSVVIPAACRHKTGVRSHGRMQMQPCKRSFTFQWELLDPLCYPSQSVSQGSLNCAATSLFLRRRASVTKTQILSSVGRTCHGDTDPLCASYIN